VTRGLSLCKGYELPLAIQAMHGPTATIAAASSAGTVGVARVGLRWRGESAYAGYRIADEMEKEKNVNIHILGTIWKLIF
jgi:hypothetical protein